METIQRKSPLTAVVQQVINNTTSWIGQQFGETKNRVSGQTFTCPTEGDLDSIEIFSTYITKNVPVDLTIHLFDSENKSWGPELRTSTVEFNRIDSGKWISFPLQGLHLQKGKTYAFRLKSDAGLIGVGEAASGNNHLPFTTGQEWVSNSDDLKGNYFSYLNLAYKVEMRA